MQRVLYISACLSKAHSIYALNTQFPASQTLGSQVYRSQLEGTQFVGSRPAFSSKPAVNANAALEADEPTYDHLNSNSRMEVSPEHGSSAEHHYSHASLTHAVPALLQPAAHGQHFQAPSQQAAHGQYFNASSQPAAPVKDGFQVPPQQVTPGQYAVQAPTQLAHFLGKKPSLHDVVKAAPVPFTYRKLVPCASILKQSEALHIPMDIATSFETLLSEITKKDISPQTEKNVLAIFESMTSRADSSLYTILEHMNTCEVDQGGSNIFQRLIRTNMVKLIQSDFVKALLFKSDTEPFLVVDNNDNNIVHLAIMTGNPFMLKAVVALHDMYQQENNGPPSNRITFLASVMEAKNKAGKTPHDLAKSMKRFDLLLTIKELYRLNSLLAETLSKA